VSRYPDIANPDLLDRIPLSARAVLDVGCGTGALGRDYRLRNPAAVLVGIERDAEAAEVARRRMNHVLEGDVERDPLPFRGPLPPGGFDCIVYGDILEHLADPWAVLRRQVQSLSPDGVVLICMPNVEHWSFVERLLRGTWQYEPHGLFDRTHLRWFTTDMTKHALEEAGLYPLDVTARSFNVEAAEAFVRALQPGLQRLGVDAGKYLQRAAPLQYVWRALRTRRPIMSLISSKLDPIGGVSEVRVVQPMRALASEPGILAQVIGTSEIPSVQPGLPTILILHRPALVGDAGIDFLRRVTTLDCVTVCEFDDHPDYIPVLQREDMYNFRGVDAVQTSTEALATLLREQNPEIAVFPNGVDRIPEVVNFQRPDRLTLFFGGINRDNDWPPLLQALNNVAGMARERLHFRIVADRALFDALQTPFKEFTPLTDYTTYTKLLASSEVCLMPLADTPFNRCKSDLKFLEASAHRLVSLASTVAYQHSIEDGVTGFLFRDASEMQGKLVRLIATPDTARSVADAARLHVARTRMLAYQIARRIAWYRSLWTRRQELRAALLARMPELVPAGTAA
jgi:SAM-dependent methyltransferase